MASEIPRYSNITKETRWEANIYPISKISVSTSIYRFRTTQVLERKGNERPLPQHNRQKVYTRLDSMPSSEPTHTSILHFTCDVSQPSGVVIKFLRVEDLRAVALSPPSNTCQSIALLYRYKCSQRHDQNHYHQLSKCGLYQDNPRINVEPHTPWILFQELKTPEELWMLVEDYVVSVRIVVVYQANLNL